MSKAQKLVSVSAISISMTDVREEGLVLERIQYIYYPVQFKKDTNETQVQALFDSRSEVNAIHPTLVKKLGLSIRPIDIKVQKIDGITLNTYEMVVAAFSIADKANRVRFFEESFLIANISPEIVLGMPFFTLTGTNVDFLDRELR